MLGQSKVQAMMFKTRHYNANVIKRLIPVCIVQYVFEVGEKESLDEISFT